LETKRRRMCPITAVHLNLPLTRPAPQVSFVHGKRKYSGKINLKVRGGIICLGKSISTNDSPSRKEAARKSMKMEGAVLSGGPDRQQGKTNEGPPIGALITCFSGCFRKPRAPVKAREPATYLDRTVNPNMVKVLMKYMHGRQQQKIPERNVSPPGPPVFWSISSQSGRVCGWTLGPVPHW
jgi:hypothetical protein